MASIRQRNGKWQVQVRRSGQKTASKTFQQKSHAQQWAREQEVRADRGELAVDASLLRKTSVGDLVDRYLIEVTPRKRSAVAETYVLKAFRKHRICNLSLLEITGSHFAEYRDERLLSLSRTGVKREFVTLKHIFATAQHEWGLCFWQNPISQVEISAPDTGRDRRLKPGELEVLVGAMHACRNTYLLPVTLFALETAMRRGEILSTKWDNIDLERKLLHIPKSKNGYSRMVPLSAAALKVLRNLPRCSDKVFPVTSNAIRHSWERSVKRAGIENLRFHDLRHEAISRFFEKGLTVPEAASISGHRDPRMLLRYAHAGREILFEKIK